MKWINRGHEYDSIITSFQNRKGIIFIDNKNIFTEMFNKVSIFTTDIQYYKCDNDNFIGSQNNLCKEQVISLLSSKQYIAIICNTEDYSKYASELRNESFEEQVDFFNVFLFREQYLPLWVYATTGKIYANTIGHPQNWKCTLKCKECSVCIPYLSKQNTSFDIYIGQMDLLFTKFDFIYTYDLTGGETFIPSDILADIIVYLIRNYGTRIGEILITTNATIIPSKKLLMVLQACSDFVRIDVSQYKNVQGWEDKFNLFCKTLASYSIPMYLLQCESWISLWNRDSSVPISLDKAKENFNNCVKYCKLYTDYHLYHCVQGYSANEAIYHLDTDSEALDLRKESLSGIEILEFLQGYSEKGYMSICSYCKGLYGKNSQLVPIAEQLP